MKYTVFENINLSKICFGCEPLGGMDWGEVNIKDIEEAIEVSLDAGINFFDTADVYGLGLSEERLSKALGEKRHEVFIGTKGGIEWSFDKTERAKTNLNLSPQYLAKAINESLRRLRIEQIPIYYVHWPDQKVELRHTFEFLEKERQAGKIRFIGCSNFSEKQILEALQVAKVSFLQIPVNFLFNPLPKKIQLTCERENIGIIAYNVLANGLLTGKFDKNTTFSPTDRRYRLSRFKGEEFLKNLKKIDKFLEVAQNQEMSLTEFSINFVLKKTGVVSAITGFKNEKHVYDNVKIMHRI